MSSTEQKQYSDKNNTSEPVTAAVIPFNGADVAVNHENSEIGCPCLSSSEAGTKSTGTDAAESELPIERRKTHFMSSKIKKQRRKIFLKYWQTILILASFIICILSIYWGATYRESHFMHKVSVLLVMQDEPIQGHSSLVENLPVMTQKIPCTWHVYNGTEYQRKRKIRAAQINEEVIHQLHGQDYWMALNVRPNATTHLVRSLNNVSVQPFNFSDYFQVFFESGRDPNTMKTAILPNMQQLEKLYTQEVVTKYLPQLVPHLNSSVSPENLIRASNVHFNYRDYRPFYNPVILSPLQVGLIYCLLITFLQFGLYAPLHKEMAHVLKPTTYIFYRLGISFASYFLLSLFFCTVSAIFQIDFTRAFGRAGFVIYWMTTWLLMAALGGANENAASIIGIFGFQNIGFWLTTWIILNISPAFYPLVTNSNFYRYGYMMPIPNAVEIFKVIFLDTSKHAMGRNYGIICAWIGLNTCLFPVVMVIVFKNEEKKNTVPDVTLEKKDQES